MNRIRKVRLAAIVACAALTCVFYLTACDEDSSPTYQGSSPTPQQRAADVQADVRAINNALYSGDIETLLDLTHPPIIQAMGGREKAREALKEAVTAAQRMTVESIEFPTETTFLTSDKAQYAIVPTFMVLVANGRRVESHNFQLGARLIGEQRWGYVEGSRVNKDNIHQLFPDFPENVEFPKTSRTVLPDEPTTRASE